MCRFSLGLCMVGAVPDEVKYRGDRVFAAREVLERKYWKTTKAARCCRIMTEGVNLERQRLG